MKRLLFITLSLGMVSIICCLCQYKYSTSRKAANTANEPIVRLVDGQFQYVPDEPPGWPWRGITVIPTSAVHKKITEDQVEDFAGEGINLIRLHMNIPRFSKRNNTSIEESIESIFVISDELINWCEKYGIQVIISNDYFPLKRLTNYNQSSPKFWNSNEDLEDALDSIRMLVTHFDAFENVAAYSFISEPILRSDSTKSVRPPNWNDFFKRMTETIREISNKYILYTPGPGGLPGGYSDMEKKFTDPKIIYNFHFYQPHSYTHQGIKGRDHSYSYPGKINSTYWDKERLKEKVNVVLNWAEKENVKYLFAGSFSVVRWAEGKDQYLSDLLNIFEENNISWSYHSFNGWPGWSYQYEMPQKSMNSRNVQDLKKSSSKTETQKMLEQFWAKNK